MLSYWQARVMRTAWSSATRSCPGTMRWSPPKSSSGSATMRRHAEPFRQPLVVSLSNHERAQPEPPPPPEPGLYAVLGLSSSATDAEIQTAYRRRAAQLAQGEGDIT